MYSGPITYLTRDKFVHVMIIYSLAALVLSIMQEACPVFELERVVKTIR